MNKKGKRGFKMKGFSPFSGKSSSPMKNIMEGVEDEDVQAFKGNYVSLSLGKVTNDNSTSGGDIWDNDPSNLCDGEAYTDHNAALYTAISGSSTLGGYFAARAEEDISSTHYFVRVKNSEYNFSNNPTFSTTVGQLQNSSMVGNPNVYITTVGLYNDENELVATAKLSKPLLKNFSREATVRVKLDY